MLAFLKKFSDERSRIEYCENTRRFDADVEIDVGFMRAVGTAMTGERYLHDGLTVYEMRGFS